MGCLAKLCIKKFALKGHGSGSFASFTGSEAWSVRSGFRLLPPHSGGGRCPEQAASLLHIRTVCLLPRVVSVSFSAWCPALPPGSAPWDALWDQATSLSKMLLAECPPRLPPPTPRHQTCIWPCTWGTASQPQSRTHWGGESGRGKGEKGPTRGPVKLIFSVPWSLSLSHAPALGRHLQRGKGEAFPLLFFFLCRFFCKQRSLLPP